VSAPVIDLLALLAYGELQAFDQMAADARLAPDLHRRAVLSEMAAAEIVAYRRLAERLAQLGAEPETAMRPFVPALEQYHDQTSPKDWLEALTKAYVGDGIAADFYRAIAVLLDSQTRQLVLDVLADTGHADFVISRVRAAIDADPAVAGRLALWARRLVGEALAQAHRVAAERAPLARLVAGGAVGQAGPGGEQGEIGRMFARLTDAHDERMTALGLTDWERVPESE